MQAEGIKNLELACILIALRLAVVERAVSERAVAQLTNYLL